MAAVTKLDQMRYIELGNFVVDFNDGDILMFDSVKDITPLYPLKPMTTLIAVCSKGSQQLQVNGNDIQLSEGNIFICPPNVRVIGDKRSFDFECKVLCISDNIIHGLLREKYESWHHAIYVNRLNIIKMCEVCKEELGFYLALVSSKLKRRTIVAPYDILLALLRALLFELYFMLDSINGEYQKQKLSQGKILFNRFLNLISNSQVKRQPISHYASLMAITPKYLTMLCLKYSNKTASQWVAQYTVEEIRFYLKSTELSIKEISAKMGFSNMSHFGSYVRKHLGISPSEYRYAKQS